MKYKLLPTMKIIGFIFLVIGVSAPFVLPYYFVSKLREWGEREPVALVGLIVLTTVASLAIAFLGVLLYEGKI